MFVIFKIKCTLKFEMVSFKSGNLYYTLYTSAYKADRGTLFNMI